MGDNGVFEGTKTGTPQGGVISPLLANIALHGMINDITTKFPRFKYRNGKTEKAGFDFLGFNIRSYPVGKHKSGSRGGNTGGRTREKIGFITLTKPSKKEILAHHEAIKEVIKANRNAPQSALIDRLNPIIRGWCNYYRTAASSEIFSSEDHILWRMLRAWTVSRKKGKTSIQNALSKYFSNGKNGKWTFQNGKYALYSHADTEIMRHTLVKPM